MSVPPNGSGREGVRLPPAGLAIIQAPSGGEIHPGGGGRSRRLLAFRSRLLEGHAGPRVPDQRAMVGSPCALIVDATSCTARSSTYREAVRRRPHQGHRDPAPGGPLANPHVRLWPMTPTRRPGRRRQADRQRSAQQFAQPRTGWSGRAAAIAAATLTVASQPAPTEAYRDDVTGAVTYYVPQTFSDYRDGHHLLHLCSPVLGDPTAHNIPMVDHDHPDHHRCGDPDRGPHASHHLHGDPEPVVPDGQCPIDQSCTNCRGIGVGPTAGKGLQPAACLSSPPTTTGPELPHGVPFGAPPYRRALRHASWASMALQRGLRPQSYREQCSDPHSVFLLHECLDPDPGVPAQQPSLRHCARALYGCCVVFVYNNSVCRVGRDRRIMMGSIPSFPRLPLRTVFLQAPQCLRHLWVSSPSQTRTRRNYRPPVPGLKALTSPRRNISPPV